jgi:sulfite exporter TauE/SafE
MRGFLLGLSSGVTCLAFCAPALIPFLMHEGQTVRRNVVTLLKFLGGRIGGYLIFGLLAWATGSLLSGTAGYEGLLVGVAYMGLSVVLLVTVLRKRAPSGTCAFKGAQATLNRWPALLPIGMGFLAGLKVCPPLLLAFTDAASSGSLAGSLIFFLAFFLGTSIYFVPIPLLGVFRRVSALQTVAQFAAAIVALYYAYSGILLCIGGIYQL